MPLKHYGVLSARVLDTRAGGGSGSPHFQIHAGAGDVAFRVAVNVLSQQSPSDLLFVADEAFDHPILAGLPELPDGFTRLPNAPDGHALDFVRGNLFQPGTMTALPAMAPGPDNDLADKLRHFADRARADSAARLYAFGERWGPERGKRDQVFGFSPGNGVHDIHLNQGNSTHFQRDDGVWQDGGLLLHFPATRQWVAVFLAFQSQSWHTDDSTGHALRTPTAVGPGEPDRIVRIVAALVADDHRATVTLLNTGVQDIDLAEWVLSDARGSSMPLPSIRLPGGEAARIPVQGELRLDGDGGLLSLLDPAGLKIDGVAYTGRQARPAGRTLVF